MNKGGARFYRVLPVFRLILVLQPINVRATVVRRLPGIQSLKEGEVQSNIYRERFPFAHFSPATAAGAAEATADSRRLTYGGLVGITGRSTPPSPPPPIKGPRRGDSGEGRVLAAKQERKRHDDRHHQSLPSGQNEPLGAGVGNEAGERGREDVALPVQVGVFPAEYRK